MKNEESYESEELNFLNILIIILSVYVLAALLIEAFIKIPTEISRLLVRVDNIICLVFLYDFLQRLFRSKNKLRFMRWGWIDLISSIPNLAFMRVGRTIRLIRLLRILRAFRSAKYLIHHIFIRRKKEGTLTAVALIAVTMILFSSIAILQVEQDPKSNIKTAEDALWWTYVTFTTIGYGDKYPVTTEGRIIGALLITVGVGVFGTFTAYMASWFIGESRKDDENEKNNETAKL
jgi:voltage-gated potassium channel